MVGHQVVVLRMRVQFPLVAQIEPGNWSGKKGFSRSGSIEITGFQRAPVRLWREASEIPSSRPNRD